MLMLMHKSTNRIINIHIFFIVIYCSMIVNADFDLDQLSHNNDRILGYSFGREITE